MLNLKIKKYLFVKILIISFIIFPAYFVKAQEHTTYELGIVEEIGKHFEITDSEYLNVSLDSSENISARVESAPEMVVLNIKNSVISSSTYLKLSGLVANTTYHKYQDGYQNHEPFTTDKNGVFSFDLELNQSHIIFIQPRKSTIFIHDADGGDCKNIGDWDTSLKTCTLDKNVNETIEVYTDGITLNGNGYTVSGSATGTGIYVSGENIVIKNVTVTNFYYGVYLNNTNHAKVTDVIAKNNKIGIELYYAENSIISNCTVEESYSDGLLLYYSKSNTISNNMFGPGNSYGIQQAYTGDYNIYENNNISNNKNTGIKTYGGGNYITFQDNKIISNAYDGMIIGGDHHTLSGNIMSGNGYGGWNGKSNFSIASGDMDTNNIDQSNMIEGKPLYYLKDKNNEIYDNLDAGSFYCINCDNITLKGTSLPEHATTIFFWHTNNSIIESITSPDKNARVYLYYSSNNMVKNSELGKIGIYYSSSNNQIYNNNFSDPNSPVYMYNSAGNLFNLDPPIGGNFWKKNEAACININNDNFCDAPFAAGGATDNYPQIREFDFNATSSGASSVLFLPGIQSSRLYEKAGGLGFRLWEPEDSVENLQRLYLDKNGNSISDGIYTKDILDEVYGFNIYKKFISYMDGIVSDNTIKGWKAVPYDWRLPLEDIVDGKIKLEDGEMDIVDELEALAGKSNTGKVTIIGHSNGGLLGKVLIDRLKTLGKANLVDKFIMVATPQVGTPKALVGLLHGDKLDIPGTMLNRNRARTLSENMSSAYNLLPSKKYFEYVQTPVVEFEDDVKDIYDFEELYGDKIDNKEELDKFLTGDDGERLDPSYADTDSPNVLDSGLLSDANSIHNNLLDIWSAPENVEVIQIAGWGLDTIAGIKYDDCDIVFCPDNLSNLDRKLIFKKDGDKTVVIPSAIIMNDGEIYYVNMNNYNDDNFINRDHANILEINSTQEFIKNILNNKRDLPPYIIKDKPAVVSADDSLRYRMHSPIAVHLYDESNNHTGIKNNSNSESDLVHYEENIPNSYYLEFGETKYLGSPGDGNIRVELIGEDTGTFTFEIDELSGDDVDKTTTFKDVPVIKDMRADIDISQNIGIMEIDWNNDEKVDTTIDTEEVNSAPKASLKILEEIIKSSKINPILKNLFLNELKVAQKQIAKGKNKVAGQILEILEKQIETFSDKKMLKKLRIDKTEAENLIKIIKTIRLNLIK